MTRRERLIRVFGRCIVMDELEFLLRASVEGLTRADVHRALIAREIQRLGDSYALTAALAETRREVAYA